MAWGDPVRVRGDRRLRHPWWRGLFAVGDMSPLFFQPVLDSRDGRAVVAFKVAAAGIGLNCTIPFDVLKRCAESIGYPLDCPDSHLRFATECQPYFAELALARRDGSPEVVLTFADLKV